MIPRRLSGIFLKPLRAWDYPNNLSFAQKTMLTGAGQFHFFPLCNVAAGGSALVSTVATGGLGAGVTFVEKHLGILPIRLDRAECLHQVANFNIPV